MATHQPAPNPATWKEFEVRARERIKKIRDANETGLYANMYADDVEKILAVLADCQLDYDGTAAESYKRVVLCKKHCSCPWCKKEP